MEELVCIADPVLRCIPQVWRGPTFHIPSHILHPPSPGLAHHGVLGQEEAQRQINHLSFQRWTTLCCAKCSPVHHPSQLYTSLSNKPVMDSEEIQNVQGFIGHLLAGHWLEYNRITLLKLFCFQSGHRGLKGSPPLIRIRDENVVSNFLNSTGIAEQVSAPDFAQGKIMIFPKSFPFLGAFFL